MTIAANGDTPMKTDIDMTMAAVGVRAQVLDAGAGDALDMAVRTDALWLRATSDATTDMMGAEADVTRLRLMIDTSRGFTLASGGTLTPSLEAGIRQDGGDAETGLGFELGGGLQYQATASPSKARSARSSPTTMTPTRNGARAPQSASTQAAMDAAFH